ncbi:hypothetical protein LSCM1_04220 [Leishmania martiniquensis]|uniref:Ubiquitin-like protease family profile domain-containing protein n=1 Tax=Leishmania martiniquensis TaxID=1580590 RepID=A0A836GZ86_9TRYP|nr:hypothetical protein LSCM1_04220 [Leishmania martiniquensis]
MPARSSMISPLSARHLPAAEASPKSFSLSFAATFSTVAEPHPARRDSEGDVRKPLTPPFSTRASTATLDMRMQDLAAQPEPVPSPTRAFWRPARSPTIRPPPNALLPANLHGRRAHLLLASGADVTGPCEATTRRLPGSSTASLASAHTSGMATTHSSTPPPYALVMDSLVRRYRAEEDRLSQWRQDGGRCRSSAPSRHGAVQLRRRSRGTEKKEWLAQAGSRGSADAALNGHGGRDTDNGPQGALASIVQGLALVRAVQSWWRRGARPRAAGKASKRWHRKTLPVSAAEVSSVGTLRLSATAVATVLSSPAAESAAPRAWMSRAGRTVLECFSQSLSLSSERGKSVVLELLRSADAAQSRSVQSVDHEDAVYDSLNEDQQVRGTRMTEATAAAASADVVAPALSLSWADDNAAVTHPREMVLARDAASGRGGSHQRQPPHAERRASDGGDSDACMTSSTCSSRVSSVCSGDGAGRSSEALGGAERRQEARRVSGRGGEGSSDLSWFGGLRMHRLGSAAASSRDDAEAAFGSAPSLLERSCVRLSRWLRLRRRRRAAKRSQRGAGAWWKPTTAADAEPLDALSGLRYLAAAPPPFSTTAELHRRAAQAAPSPWEAAVPRTQADRGDSDTTLGNEGATPCASAVAAERSPRAPILERLRAVVAAGAAAWNVQQGGVVGPKTSLEVPSSDSEAPVISLAAQRSREHAADLARLTESLTMLTEFDGRAPAGGRDEVRARRANSPKGVTCASLLTENQEQIDAAALSSPSASKATTSALPACSPFRARPLSIVSAGQHRRSYHGDSRNSRDVKPHACGVKDHLHAAEDEAAAGAFRSLLTDTTHTPHNVAVREAYEAIMNEVCTPLARRAVENAIDVSRSAADRALTQWIERRLILELTQSCAREKQVSAEGRQSAAPSATTSQPLVFTGVTQHIRSGVPVSIEHLRLDGSDRQTLESVKARSASDAIAVKFDTSGYDISYRQLSSLDSQSWLNDQVINNYLQLLCVEAEGAAHISFPAAQRRHRIASLGTHFYTTIESELRRRSGGSIDCPPCLPQLDSGSAAFRWLRNRQHLLEPYSPSDPRSVRAVLVPVNIEAQHWALAVFYRADNRWVMYDSMSRSGAARQRGHVIVTHLSHVWRECQRHFGIVHSEGTTATEHSRSSAAPKFSLWASACVVAAPYVPFTDTLGTKRRSTAVSPLDSLEPYHSLDQLHRAAKRVRHQAGLFAEEAAQTALQVVGGGGRTGGIFDTTCSASAAPVLPPPPLPLATVKAIPAGQLSDTEVEWFTGGFDHIPQQANGNDCGVFVCQAAWCVAQGVAVSFAQSDVARLREVILLELFNKQLLRRYPTANTSSSAGV